MSNAGYPETRVAVAAYLSQDQGVDLTGAHVVMTVRRRRRAQRDPQGHPRSRGRGHRPGALLRGVRVVRGQPRGRAQAGGQHGRTSTSTSTPSRRPSGRRPRPCSSTRPTTPPGRVYPAETLGGSGRPAPPQVGRDWAASSTWSPTSPTGASSTTGSRCRPSWPPTRTASSPRATPRSCRSRARGSATRPPTRPSPTSAAMVEALTMTNRILGFVNAPALMQRVVARLQGVSVDISPVPAQPRRALRGAGRGGLRGVQAPGRLLHVPARRPSPTTWPSAGRCRSIWCWWCRVAASARRATSAWPTAWRPQVVDGAIPAIKQVGAKYFKTEAPAGAAAAPAPRWRRRRRTGQGSCL